VTFSKKVSMTISRISSLVDVFFSSMSRDGEHLRSYIGWMLRQEAQGRVRVHLIEH
jgi:hypothetical protein